MEAPPLERKLVAHPLPQTWRVTLLTEIDRQETLATLSSTAASLMRRLFVIAEGSQGPRVTVYSPNCERLGCAVHAAVEIQFCLLKPTMLSRRSNQMQFRIGVNAGDVMVKDGDIFGDGVNIAARLESPCRARRDMCVARRARLHPEMGRGRVRRPWEQRVKNIARPIRAFNLRLHGSGILSSEDGRSESVIPEPPPQADEVEIEFWDSIKAVRNPLEYRAYF